MQNPNDTFNVGISFSLVLLLSKLVICHKHSTNPLLLLISFDGFRWDYLKNHSLSNFEALKQNGSYADFVYSSFSTVTFPNHWTLVTGLYEESHGIIQNEMYDPVLQKTFSYTSSESQTIEWYGQNKQVEPIWTSNQKADKGRRSAAEWVGANVVFDNQTINYIPYNRSTAYTDLVDKFVALFTDAQQPINFGALYFDEPDHTGHLYGPYSNEIRLKLLELDSLIGYLIEKLKSNHLLDKLNIIITSDHGMETTSASSSIFLNDFINISLFRAHGSNTVKNVFLKNQTDKDKVLNALKNIRNLRIYRKDDFPDNFHYKNNIRFGDILLIADLGYTIYLKNDSKVNHLNGTHGYFNNYSSMSSIFLAYGPAFKKNFRIENFKNIDIYELMCAVLKINPNSNNGSLENVRAMLYVPKKELIIYSIICVTPVITALLTAIALFIINKRNRLPGQIMLNDGYMMLATSEAALLDSNNLEETNITT